MQIGAKGYINTPVISFVNGEVLGTISQVIVDPQRLKVLCFAVNLPHSSKKLYLLSNDVRDITREHCIVDSENSLTPIDDLIRLQASLREPILLFRYQVKTSVSHKKLGRCSDFTFQADTMELARLYVRNSNLQQLYHEAHIITANDILKIEHKIIYVKDAFAAPEKKPTKNTLPVHTT